MANPFSSACKTTGAAKMRAIGGSCGGMAKGGGVHHAKKMHHAGKHHGDMKVAGKKGGGRLDKIRRDKGGMHKRSKLNISAAVPPPPMDVAPTPMPPPGMSAGPMPAPGMMKHGGYVKRAHGGRIRKDGGGSIVPSLGGRVPKAGMDSGQGRIQLSKIQRGKNEH